MCRTFATLVSALTAMATIATTVLLFHAGTLDAFSAVGNANRFPWTRVEGAFKSTGVPTALGSSTSASATNNDAAFTAFADSLDEEEDSSLSPEAENVDFTWSADVEEDDEMVSWQESLEMLMDPGTSTAKRQVLFSDLMGANEEIRESVMTALRERKVDPILTPTGKRLQDGTRAVARQITMDIIPGIAEAVRSTGPDQRSKITNKITEELPSLVPKIGERVFNAFSTQARKQLDLLRGDIADPTRIPKRISEQTADIATEARNMFLDTPEGLAEPKYTVVYKAIGYEIREYEGYTAAATSMAKVGEPFSEDDLASEGAAFNAIAAYIFGANDEDKSMDMTTPVSTTSSGEMRFFLKKKDGMSAFPAPLAVEDKINEKGAVKLVDVPPARLAVARFTGFVTAGEVARQKDALLSALAIDEVEIDVPHGSVVPYFVFQYNPPYTLPIVRRNEVAIPVRAPDEGSDLEKEWSADEEDSNIEAPSDVE